MTEPQLLESHPLSDRITDLLSQAEAFARSGDHTAAVSRSRDALRLVRDDTTDVGLEASVSLAVAGHAEALRRWQAAAEERQHALAVREGVEPFPSS
jgi:hypothetical protein